jgi:hypothetical protein
LREKSHGSILPWVFGTPLTTKRHLLPFFTLIKRKSFYCVKNIETIDGNDVCHAKIYLCAHFGKIIMNYAMDLAINLVIWVESQAKSHDIV